MTRREALPGIRDARFPPDLYTAVLEALGGSFWRYTNRMGVKRILYLISYGADDNTVGREVGGGRLTGRLVRWNLNRALRDAPT